MSQINLDPSELSVAERYKLLIGSVTPRPIAFVSTISTEGASNLAPYSFFNAAGSNPMTLLFCPANNIDGSEKDTLRNAKTVEEGGTGEFVVNIASYAYAKQVAAAGEPLEHGDSEFTFVGLTEEPSARVRPPRVAECVICFECKTRSVTRLAPGEPAGANIVMGEVVHVRAYEGLLNDRMHVDPAMLDSIGRMGGFNYCDTRNRFELPIGKAALAPISGEAGEATS